MNEFVSICYSWHHYRSRWWPVEICPALGANCRAFLVATLAMALPSSCWTVPALLGPRALRGMDSPRVGQHRVCRGVKRLSGQFPSIFQHGLRRCWHPNNALTVPGLCNRCALLHHHWRLHPVVFIREGGANNLHCLHRRWHNIPWPWQSHWLHWSRCAALASGTALRLGAKAIGIAGTALPDKLLASERTMVNCLLRQ